MKSMQGIEHAYTQKGVQEIVLVPFSSEEAYAGSPEWRNLTTQCKLRHVILGPALTRHFRRKASQIGHLLLQVWGRVFL